MRSILLILILVLTSTLQGTEGSKFKNTFDISDTIHFYLFPFPRNPDYHQELKVGDNLENTEFKPNIKTIIIIHGFWPNSTQFTPSGIKDAYLQTGLDLNIIYLDWSLLSTPNPQRIIKGLTYYPKIVQEYIPLVSHKLAHFINFLKNYVDLNHIHIVGYSLGAHVAGLCGQLVQVSNGGRKVGRITGLDPAIPLFRNWFRYEWGTYRLNKNDAQFVDVYHTSMNTFGRHRQDGHVDFYPNGGRSPQPGCLVQELKVPIVCSHLFVVKLYIESIQRNFVACKCEPFLDFLVGVACIGHCRYITLAGDQCPSNARGRYYFKTGALMGQIYYNK